jgi:hypothetical protein
MLKLERYSFHSFATFSFYHKGGNRKMESEKRLRDKSTMENTRVLKVIYVTKWKSRLQIILTELMYLRPTPGAHCLNYRLNNILPKTHFLQTPWSHLWRSCLLRGAFLPQLWICRPMRFMLVMNRLDAPSDPRPLNLW